MKRHRLVLLALLVGILVSNAAFASQGAGSAQLGGVTYLDVPARELGGPTTPSSLQVDSLSVQNSELDLRGQVAYNGTQYPLHLTGTFFKSVLGSASDRVVEATDISKNFTVLQVAVRKNPPVEALLVNKEVKGPILFIYLQRQGTREVTFVESPISGQGGQQGLTEVMQAARPEGTFSADYWAHKLFPTQEVSSDTPDISIQAVQGSDPRTYSQYYELGNGCWVKYYINFQGFANGPSDIARGAGDYNYVVEILRKWTDSNCAFYRTERSPYQLGEYGRPINVKIKTYGNNSNSGDVLLKGRYNGTFETKSFPGQPSIRLGLSYKVASIGYTIPLCCTKGVNPNEEYVFSNSDPSNWTKLANYDYNDRRLRLAGHRFQAIVQLAWGTGARGNKPIEGQWAVPVYDDMGSCIYTSYPTVRLSYISG